MHYSILRCPRNYVNKRNHRYLGVKKNDIVWYYIYYKKNPKLAGWNRYRVTELEDHFFDQKRDPSDPKQHQKNYCRYAWLKSLKKTGPSPTWGDRTPDVMRYNNKLWNSGAIGHSVDYTEYYHSLGEALASQMRTGLRTCLHIKHYQFSGCKLYRDPTHDSNHIKDYVPDYAYIQKLNLKNRKSSKHVKDFDGLTNTYITHGRPSRHIKDQENYKNYSEGKPYYV